MLTDAYPDNEPFPTHLTSLNHFTWKVKDDRFLNENTVLFHTGANTAQYPISGVQME